MNPARVLFGPGTRTRLAEEVSSLGAKRAVVLSTPEQAQLARDIGADLGSLSVGILAEARMHTPVAVTEKALREITSIKADCLVAVGGGSTIGLAKALALRTDLPIVAMPTTYAGSEMTPIIGETKDGRKVTQSTPRVLPETVIYDIDFTYTLPKDLSIVSGLNAMAHSIEALYAKDGNPVVTAIAKESIASLAGGLRKLAQDDTDRDAREKLLYGAWLAGMCLGLVGMALHHKLCHTLGGMFDLPHAPTHAVILPHAVSFNSAAAGQAMQHLSDALQATDPVQALFNLVHDIGAPTRLADIGMPGDGIEAAARQAAANPYWNPRPITEDDLHQLLQDAHEGVRPGEA